MDYNDHASLLGGKRSGKRSGKTSGKMSGGGSKNTHKTTIKKLLTYINKLDSESRDKLLKIKKNSRKCLKNEKIEKIKKELKKIKEELKIYTIDTVKPITLFDAAFKIKDPDMVDYLYKKDEEGNGDKGEKCEEKDEEEDEEDEEDEEEGPNENEGDEGDEKDEEYEKKIIDIEIKEQNEALAKFGLEYQNELNELSPKEKEERLEYLRSIYRGDCSNDNTLDTGTHCEPERRLALELGTFYKKDRRFKNKKVENNKIPATSNDKLKQIEENRELNTKLLEQIAKQLNLIEEMSRIKDEQEEKYKRYILEQKRLVEEIKQSEERNKLEEKHNLEEKKRVEEEEHNLEREKNIQEINQLKNTLSLTLKQIEKLKEEKKLKQSTVKDKEIDCDEQNVEQKEAIDKLKKAIGDDIVNNNSCNNADVKLCNLHKALQTLLKNALTEYNIKNTTLDNLNNTLLEKIKGLTKAKPTKPTEPTEKYTNNIRYQAKLHKHCIDMNDLDSAIKSIIPTCVKVGFINKLYKAIYDTLIFHDVIKNVIKNDDYKCKTKNSNFNATKVEVAPKKKNGGFTGNGGQYENQDQLPTEGNINKLKIKLNEELHELRIEIAESNVDEAKILKEIESSNETELKLKKAEEELEKVKQKPLPDNSELNSKKNEQIEKMQNDPLSDAIVKILENDLGKKSKPLDEKVLPVDTIRQGGRIHKSHIGTKNTLSKKKCTNVKEINIKKIMENIAKLEVSIKELRPNRTKNPMKNKLRKTGKSKRKKSKYKKTNKKHKKL